ncbi:MAG: PfkB family carbohydrate kinase [Chloroflexi bacterium]|nr:PfkB family carbohydrate kinase [Chloroflexota bacterium]
MRTSATENGFHLLTQAPDYLVLGHITLDRTPSGYALGGTTSYGALTAQRLGYQAAVVTTGAPSEADLLEREGVLIVSASSPHPTIFENVYQYGTRLQFLRSRAGDVATTGMPPSWHDARVVHLGPLAQELDGEVVAEFPRSLIGVTPQGWLRAWDGDGRVRATDWVHPELVLSRADILVFSEQDVNGDEATMNHYVSLARIAVVTRGARGCSVFWDGQSCSLPAYEVQEVDPTGAGDVFAAAFFLNYAETHDPCVAANFANCVASFAVEAPGTLGIPRREQVSTRLSAAYVR